MRIVANMNRLQIEGLDEIISDAYQAASMWKEKTGKPVIGFFPPDVPEEIIHASGALPLGITGFPTPKSSINGYVQEYCCSLVKTSIQAVLDGKLDFLNAVVIPTICDSTRALISIWRYLNPTIEVIPLKMPKQRKRVHIRDYLFRTFESLSEKIGEITGGKITSKELNSSMTLYEENRSLLKQIFSLYRGTIEVISTKDLFGLVRASMLLPRDEINWILYQTRKEIQNIYESKTNTFKKDKIKLFIYGKVAEPIQIFEELDRLNVMVVGDTLYTGSRYFSHKLYSEQNLYERLANRELYKGPLSYYEYPLRERYLLDEVKRTEAQGVIFSHLKFCELEDYDYPLLKKALDRNNIPNIVIDTEISGILPGQLKTLLEGFIEAVADIGWSTR